MIIQNRFRTLISKLSIVKNYYLLFTRFLSSVHEYITDHPAVIFFQNLNMPKRFFSKKNAVVNYLYKLTSTLIEASLLIAATGILCFIIYYTLGMLWYLYISTPMGEKYISLYPGRAETFFEISNLNLVYFTTEVTLSAFVICFVIGIVCRFLHICRYLYLSQGLFGKLLYWGIPLTGAVAWYIKYEYDFADLKATGFIVMIPTYLLFTSCFKYSEKLTPEAGDALRIIISWGKFIFRKLLLIINDLTRYRFKQ